MPDSQALNRCGTHYLNCPDDGQAKVMRLDPGWEMGKNSKKKRMA